MVSGGQSEELDGQLELIAREDVAPKFPEPDVYEAPYSGFADFVDHGQSGAHGGGFTNFVDASPESVAATMRTVINMRNQGRVIE